VTAAFTLCIGDRVAAFLRTEVLAELVPLLAATVVSSDCAALAYCFMPDHLHIVIESRSAAGDVYEAVVRVKQQTGYWFRCNAPGVRWQKDFYDTILWNEEDILARVRYVFENPVRKQLVDHWWEYGPSGCIGVDIASIVGAVPPGVALNAWLRR
jgi:putative transposase